MIDLNPVLNKNASKPLTFIQLSNENVELDILHIGSISSHLYTFFETLNSAFNPINFKVFEDNFDIVLINNDCQIHNDLSKVIDGTELKVRYTKSFINSSTDFIDLSLIPTLLKYLFKIKHSFNLLKGTKNTCNVGVFLEKVEKVIDEHIDDHSLNMERLSTLLSMSRSAFSKKIKAYTGLKPTEYINEYKLEKSKQFLIITNWQISRIADVLGFSSQHYYCRLFKKKEGISPSQYRITNKTQ